MKQTQLANALSAWYGDHTVPRDHLPLETLYRFSLDRGLETASDSDLDHLAACPDCMDQWELLCQMDAESGDDLSPGGDLSTEKEPAPMIGWGRLKAAADDGFEPMVLKSDCGRFQLGLFPEPGEAGKGMVTLDVLSGTPAMEGARVLVKDAAGHTVLAARILHGRTAARIGNLDTLDFSLWTVSLS